LQFIDGQYEFGVISGQINILLDVWYLIQIEIDNSIINGKASTDKQYYAADEPIILSVKPNSGYKLNSISATYKSHAVVFEKTGDGLYKAENINIGDFTATDTLHISAVFDKVGQENRTWLYVLVCSAILLSIIVTTLIVIILRRKEANNG
jgi:hypothetical protein